MDNLIKDPKLIYNTAAKFGELKNVEFDMGTLNQLKEFLNKSKRQKVYFIYFLYIAKNDNLISLIYDELFKIKSNLKFFYTF